ncbi:MAG: hypothetical protein ACKOEP_07040 [Phycisphaerales bacterium]
MTSFSSTVFPQPDPPITTYKTISLTFRRASDARTHISAEKPDGA